MTHSDDDRERPSPTGTGDARSSSTSGAGSKRREQRAELETAASKHWSSRLTDAGKLFSTGLHTLDAAIGGGFARGEMVVIGARPSHGKTAMILQLLSGITTDQPALFFNSEMSQRMAGQRVNTAIMRGEKMSDWPKDRPDEWYEHFARRRSCVVWTGVRNVRRIVQLMAKDVENDYGPARPPRVVAIDYLQLLEGVGRTRYEQITDVSITLRVAASELECAVIVAAQLSREVARPTKDGRTSVRMPVLSDLRDSGQIEQDADVVLLLQWPWKEDPGKPKHEFKVAVAKNRNRAIVTPHLLIAFDASSQTFMTLDEWKFLHEEV